MVYRKPTHTDQYLAFDSHHPQSVKRGIVKCLHDRAKRIITKPSGTAQEKKHLSAVLIANGYPMPFLQKVTKTKTPAPERETKEYKSMVVLPYVKGLSETLRRNLQQQGIRTVFKSDTTIRSQLVRPKDPADPNQQDGIVYKIPCECGKVYIGETGRPIQERIKEHDRDIRFARTQNSAVSEHANITGHKPLWKEVKFIDKEKHWYTRKVKEAIHISLNPNNINRDNGLEIPKAWITTIKKHQNHRCATYKRTSEETAQNENNRIEISQSQQTTTIHNAAPKPVDPIA